MLRDSFTLHCVSLLIALVCNVVYLDAFHHPSVLCIMFAALLYAGSIKVHAWADWRPAQHRGSIALTCICASIMAICSAGLMFKEADRMASTADLGAESCGIALVLLLCMLLGMFHMGVSSSATQMTIILLVCAIFAMYQDNLSDCIGSALPMPMLFALGMAIGSLRNCSGRTHSSAQSGSVGYSAEHRPPSPPPSPPPPSLKLLMVTNVLTEMINSPDKEESMSAVESIYDAFGDVERHGYVLRTPSQEHALRELVAFCDVRATEGLSSRSCTLDDACLWHASNFLGRRQDSKVPWRAEEICEFLCDATINYMAEQSPLHYTAEPQNDGEDDEPFEVITEPGNDMVFIFKFAPEDHPAAVDMLTAFGLEWTKTTTDEGQTNIRAVLSGMAGSAVVAESLPPNA